jgi:methyltransferase (TIGR00027 family)
MINKSQFGLSQSEFDSVSHTAKIVAAKRAIEQFHPTPLFDDPFSQRLAKEEVAALQAQWQEAAQRKGLSLADVIIKRTRYIAIRTRFIDNLLRSALSKSQVYQIVILGAGLDTRAFRLSYPPNTTLYEVDRSAVLHYKAKVLQDVFPRCQHRLVPGDLADPSSAWVTELFNAGYRHRIPTLWVMEGIVMYLKPKEVHTLLKTLSSLSVEKSILGMDSVKAGSVQAGQRAAQRDRGRVIRHWHFGDDNLQELLACYGWSASVYQPQEVENGYGRYPQAILVEAAISDPQDERGVWLVRAQT